MYKKDLDRRLYRRISIILSLWFYSPGREQIVEAATGKADGGRDCLAFCRFFLIKFKVYFWTDITRWHVEFIDKTTAVYGVTQQGLV